MPYVIPRPSKGRRALAVASAGLLTWFGAAALGAAPARADSMPDTSACSDPVLTQPFTGFNDQNYYTLVPGESADSFDGTGWTLTGGASIQTATLADGSSGSVLDLPGGSTAISPPVCVNSTYTTARAIVSDLAGRGRVRFDVNYAGTGASQHRWLRGADQGAGWGLSDPVGLNPGDGGNWVMAQFSFSSLDRDQTDDYQLYDFYLDPYSRG